MWNISRTNNAELAHRLKPHRFTLVRDVGPRAAFFIGAVDDLVVDIGDIGNESHRQSSPREVAAQDVVDQSGSAMTQMGWPVDRRAT